VAISPPRVSVQASVVFGFSPPAPRRRLKSWWSAEKNAAASGKSA
jgi:hypothetical protein